MESSTTQNAGRWGEASPLFLATNRNVSKARHTIHTRTQWEKVQTRNRRQAMAASTSPASLLLPAASAPRSGGSRCSGGAAVCCVGRGLSPGDSHGRRQSLLLLSLSAAPLAFGLAPAQAEDIPLFGLKKKLRKIEEAAEEIVREGENAVEQGIEAAAKEIQVAEREIGEAAKQIQVAEREIGAAAATAEKDIPLFGLKKNLRKIEKEAEEIVRKGEKAVEQGIVSAQKEIQVAEREIGEAAAAGATTGLELGLGGDLVQAGAVAAAEVVGVLAAVSIVNAILGSEARNTS